MHGRGAHSLDQRLGQDPDAEQSEELGFGKGSRSDEKEILHFGDTDDECSGESEGSEESREDSPQSVGYDRQRVLALFQRRHEEALRYRRELEAQGIEWLLDDD